MILRLVLDLLGMGLLLAALAYYWSGNLLHEVAGTAMFVLLLAHNTFNRWWWAGLPRPRRTAGARAATTVNLVLLATMSALLVSSVLISQTLFSVFGFQGGFAARQVHKLAAYWAFAVASVHLGLHWPVVMRAVRDVLHLSPRGAWVVRCLRLAAAAIAVEGVQSSFEIAFGSKLVLRPVLEMWDFEESVAGFFVRYGSIAGLYVALGHYGAAWLRPRRTARSGEPG